MKSDVAVRRLRAQRIAGEGFKTPAEVVAWMGAVQAQDYLGALWAVGLRMKKATEAIVEQAIAEGSIVRTWPMRGTLHFVAPADVRWMLELLSPRVLARGKARYRQLELEQKDFDRSRDVLVQALEGGRHLTRKILFEILDAKGISTAGQRGIHILQRHALDGLLCFAPRQGKQPAFALLEEWVPPARKLTPDEALAELARRYFTSRGPATLQDFSWWSGLTVADAKRAMEMSNLEKETLGGKPAPAYLLPPYDEYTVAYKDRSAVLDPAHGREASGNGIFHPILVLGGQVAGTWKRELKKDCVAITLSPFKPLTKKEQGAVAEAAERYGSFLGKSVRTTASSSSRSRTVGSTLRMSR